MSQQNLASGLGAKVAAVTVTGSFPFDASEAGTGWAPLPQDISGYEEGQKKAASSGGVACQVSKAFQQEAQRTRRQSEARSISHYGLSPGHSIDDDTKEQVVGII